ncbi:MAG TPA: acetoacetate decarboxylase [Thermodesulfobacteriota bacterium]|nr:acetoacetate decarboxylase [Thermodesulfobacteriota bacterium]
MKLNEIKKHLTIPLESPSYPPGPYYFHNREYLIISYRTDPEAIRRIVPEPLDIPEPIAKFEVINMPDSSGFGSYIESGVVIPVVYNGMKGSFNVWMFLNDHPPIAAGREIWGFPKKWGEPSLKVIRDQLVGTLDYSGVRVATATMAYEYEALDIKEVKRSMEGNNFNLKIIPSADGSVALMQLVRYQLQNVTVKWAWKGPATLDIRPCALAPLYKLPVIEVIEGVHQLTDLTLPYGEVIYDYLEDKRY